MKKSAYIDNLAEMPINIKKAYLTYLCTQEHNLNEQLKAQLKTLLASDEDDSLRAMTIQIMGASIDEACVRDALTDILPKLQINSLSYYFIKAILVAALFDDMEEVRMWGIRLIKEYEKINPENKNELSAFLSRNLENENAPVDLRWHCALGMARVGTRLAIEKLLLFGTKLLLKIPIFSEDSETDLQRSDKFLLEKVAYSIGMSVEKVCAYGKTSESLMLLARIAERMGDSEEYMGSVTWAINRLKPFESIRPVKSKLSFQSFLQLFTFRFTGAAAAACLVIIIISSLYNISIDKSIMITGNTHRMRDGKPWKEEFQIKEGGVLKSGDSFTIRFRNQEDAYLYILLYDSSKEITGLFSDKVTSGKTMFISKSKDGSSFILNDVIGKETLYFLTLKEPIENFDKKLDELRSSGIDKIGQIFPTASIRTFWFSHE
jgi:hypothetical protein